jgi:hypothetical protein
MLCVFHAHLRIGEIKTTIHLSLGIGMELITYWTETIY